MLFKDISLNILKGLLLLFVILYGSLARLPLNDRIYSIVNNKFFSTSMLVIIAFIGTHDLISSFIIGLLFSFIMYKVSEKKIQEYFIDKISNEAFIDTK